LSAATSIEQGAAQQAFQSSQKSGGSSIWYGSSTAVLGDQQVSVSSAVVSPQQAAANGGFVPLKLGDFQASVPFSVFLQAAGSPTEPVALTVTSVASPLYQALNVSGPRLATPAVFLSITRLNGSKLEGVQLAEPIQLQFPGLVPNNVSCG